MAEKIEHIVQQIGVFDGRTADLFRIYQIGQNVEETDLSAALQCFDAVIRADGILRVRGCLLPELQVILDPVQLAGCLHLLVQTALNHCHPAVIFPFCQFCIEVQSDRFVLESGFDF